MTVWRTTKARVATWFGFSLMCFGMFMAILDIQVVATSLPTIQNALKISPDAMSWIQTAYLIAEIIAIPLTGWLTRVLTLRWLFVIAISVFTVTSIGCAFSGNFETLVVFRVFQGFAGGTLIPAVFSGIFLLFPARAHPPYSGWFSVICFTLFALCAVTAALFAIRTLKAVQPVVELSTLKVRPFSIGCVLSFCLGVGLFGAVYLMPVFLAYVRQPDALEIGKIMLVTGAAQLVAAPIAGLLESRINPRWLSAFGFSLFAVGLGMSAFESRTADFDEMFWPQVLRGFAAMFCLLPPTRLALEMLPHKQVPDASGLFNMMRNLGGAVGIALIDTILYGRTSGHIEAIRQRLMAGDVATAQAIGLDKLPQDMSAAGAAIEQAAFAASTNEAWAMLAAIAVLGLLLIPLARSQRTDGG